MPAGRPPLDPEIKRQRRQESLKRYAAKKADVLRAKGKSPHVGRPGQDSRNALEREESAPREGRRGFRAVSRQAGPEGAREARAQGGSENKETARRCQHVERDALRMAHGLPPIPPNQQNPHTPHQDQSIRPLRKNRPSCADRGMKDWKYLYHPQRATTPPGPKNDPTRATSDDLNDNSPTHRAATPPIYKGGMTASTRAACPCEMPPVRLRGLPRTGSSTQMGKGISSPPAPSAAGTTVLDALASAPKARC
ncbi:hypothetical protein B0H14DRAFT_2597595 [Mycena olivaceomarginata]|nr:hypothetical protein B0H14DRAFT_2597595 [Mycena olivaceomarginata]